MEGLPSLDQEKGRLTVAFGQDKTFQVNSLQADLAVIEKTATQQYGKPVKVELILGEVGQASNVKEEIRQEVAPTQQEDLERACADDKALGDLVDMMGGQPLPESERENWGKTED